VAAAAPAGCRSGVPVERPGAVVSTCMLRALDVDLGRRSRSYLDRTSVVPRSSVVAIRGNQWQSVVVISGLTSVVAISGNQWSSSVVVITSVVRRPSWRTPRTPMRRSVSHLMREAIRAHQRSSKGHQMPAHLKRKPIRGHHQRQSEAIIRNQSSSGRLAYAIIRNHSQSFAISRHPGRLAYASRLNDDLTSIFSKTRPPRDATAASEHRASTARLQSPSQFSRSS